MRQPSPDQLRDIQPNTLWEILEAFRQINFPDLEPEQLRILLNAVERLFSGKHGSFQASDTAYHNFTHSLQVTLCWSQMLATLVEFHPEQDVSTDHFLAGTAACLLHDSGYLKETGDPDGTGAKYALIHEHRSCLICKQFLLEQGWEEDLIRITSRLIASTGPRAVIDGIPFKSQSESNLAKMLGTADFLAQMADPLYVEKLPALYSEFKEFDQFRGLQPDERIFPSFESLLSGTPEFWDKLVLPKLDYEYSKVYTLLNTPYPSGPNLYLLQAEDNIKAVRSNTLA